MKIKELTIEVPEEFLAKATAATGQGITPTVRKGPELIATTGAYAALRRLKGKVAFSVDLAKLRED